MERFAPLITAALIFAIGGMAVALSGTVTLLETTAEESASSTLSVVTDSSPVLFPQLPAVAEETATSSAPATPPVPKNSGLPPAFKQTAPPPAPAPSWPTNAELDASAVALRNALVNILCYTPAGSPIRSISGSGVFVDSKGVILTNAHIAQYFMLAEYGVSCAIRSGNPATDRYRGELLFIPEKWIRANQDILTVENPTGTGEYDFAFVAVTKSSTSLPLPAVFPSVPLAKLPPHTGTPVVIGSYGAQFLQASQIQSSLFPTLVFGSVKGVYTFRLNTIDVFSLGGSAAAQEGSSGGGVSDAQGALIGTITTSTVEGSTDTRNLDAITASYIRDQYANESGESLDLLLSRPIPESLAIFSPRISELASLLTAHLP